MKIDLSIIIVTWNGKGLIETCLNSIYKNNSQLHYEIIVVDNASKDATKSLIKKKYPGVILIENKENLGFAKANNQGLEKARGAATLLLNQDIELKPGVLDSLYNCLFHSSISKIGAVCPKLLYPGGKIQNSLRPFPTPFNVIRDIFSLGKWHQNQYDLSKSQLVDQPMASCLMLKSAILKELHGFDTNQRFFLYFNDVDLSFRFKKAGFNHYYLADQEVFHHHGKSAKKLREISRTGHWCQGLYYFLSKHYAKKSLLLKFGLFLEVYFFVFWVKLLSAKFTP